MFGFGLFLRTDSTDTSRCTTILVLSDGAINPSPSFELPNSLAISHGHASPLVQVPFCLERLVALTTGTLHTFFDFTIMTLSLEGLNFASMPPEVIRAMLAMPAMEAPPGADNQLRGPDYKWYLICIIVCMTTSGIFIIMRAYTKLVVVKHVDAADCE